MQLTQFSLNTQGNLRLQHETIKNGLAHSKWFSKLVVDRFRKMILSADDTYNRAFHGFQRDHSCNSKHARLEKVTEINLIAFTRNENVDLSKDTFYNHNHDNDIYENIRKNYWKKTLLCWREMSISSSKFNTEQRSRCMREK